jgi:preprotein translocase subunit SecG
LGELVSKPIVFSQSDKVVPSHRSQDRLNTSPIGRRCLVERKFVQLTTILLVIHLLIAIALVVVVLLQRSEGGGLGIGGGGGSGSGLVSVRGTANLLTRATAILAVCFMLTSLSLAIVAGHTGERSSVLDTERPQTESVAPKPSEPSVPLSK